MGIEQGISEFIELSFSQVGIEVAMKPQSTLSGMPKYIEMSNLNVNVMLCIEFLVEIG